MSPRRRPVHAARAPAAIGPYSHGVVAGGLLFCSGQLALDSDSGELVEGPADQQAARCLRNLGAVCEAAGGSLGDAIRLTLYLTDLEADWPAVNDAYARFFAEWSEPPARAAVGVAALPKGAAVEIDAVVALPD